MKIAIYSAFGVEHMAFIAAWPSSRVSTLWVTILQHSFIFNDLHYVLQEFLCAFSIGKFCVGFEGWKCIQWKFL